MICNSLLQQILYLILNFFCLLSCRQKQSRLISQGQGEVSDEAKAILQEEVSLSVTPTLVGVFVLCMCGMLLLLYFFFSYLGKFYIIMQWFEQQTSKFNLNYSLRHYRAVRFGVDDSCLPVP